MTELKAIGSLNLQMAVVIDQYQGGGSRVEFVSVVCLPNVTICPVGNLVSSSSSSFLLSSRFLEAICRTEIA